MHGPDRPLRRVHLNVPDLSLPDNTVTNTKYTRSTFVLKTLRQQFSKPMNQYFLLIACLQLDSSLTPVNPLSTWGPLLLVTAISMLKEHLDDRKRADADAVANARQYLVADSNGTVHVVRAADIRVGDVVKVTRDEEVPCDLVILCTSGGDARLSGWGGDGNAGAGAGLGSLVLGPGECLVQTTNIDGEADLKRRTALPQTQAVPPERLHELCGTVECAPPNADIYVFESTLLLHRLPSLSSHVQHVHGGPQGLGRGLGVGACAGQGGGGGEEHRLALSAEQMLLQATTLRSTDWAYGLAVYTGNETKLGCNKHEAPFKYPNAERTVNRFSVLIFSLQLCLTLGLGLAGVVWRARVGVHLPYLGYSQYSREPESVYFVVIPLRFLLLMSLMIPISLAVTLDILRWTYAQWISGDRNMRDPATGAGAVANSTAVPEDLGEIGIVLTDKTGTLTENEMRFRKASILGVAFGGDGASADGALADVALAERTLARDGTVLDFWRCATLCNSSAVAPRENDQHSCARAPLYTYASASPDEVALCDAAQRFGVALASRSNKGAIVLEMRATAIPGTEHGGNCRATATADAGSAAGCSAGAVGLLPQGGDCAGVLQLGPVAAALGGEGAGADSEGWTLLHELPFSSSRKRMSVVVRHDASSRLVLFSKGADDVILPRLVPSAPGTHAAAVAAATRRHTRHFAREGLRTLVFAARSLSETQVADWEAELRAARVAADHRQARLDATYSLLERNLEILGVSAIEDRLQAGVPETIQALRGAGIRVWMLTGDQQDTALKVCIACGLLSPGAAVVNHPSGVAAAGGATASGHGRGRPPAHPQAHAREREVETSATGGGGANAAGCRRAPVSGNSGSFGGFGGSFDATAVAQLQPAWARRDPSSQSTVSEGGEQNVLAIAGDSPVAVRSSVLSHALDQSWDQPFALVVNGPALEHALHTSTVADFLTLALRASVVVCTRATPDQKSRIVQAVKAFSGEWDLGRALAVGDGGNDVAMIQEAHVGVGIAGKEGLQAARAADYTVTRFAFLQRLLLIHGRRAHKRTSLVCLYTFYKSVFFASMQVLHNFSTGFSGASFFPSLAVTVWNAPLTMLTGFSLLLDEDLPDQSILAHPNLYHETLTSKDINTRVFATWLLRAVAQAAFCYGVSIATFGSVAYNHPATGACADLDAAGYFAYTAALYVQVLTVYVELQSLVVWNHAMCGACLAIFHAGFWLQTQLPLAGDSRGVIAYLYADPSYWLGAVTIACAAVWPVAAIGYARSRLQPRFYEVVQRLEQSPAPRWNQRGAPAAAPLHGRTYLRHHDDV